MANQIVMNSVMFTVFNKVKDAANESALLNENAAALVAGLFSGFATACISTPTDWFKIQAQMSLANNHNAKQSTRYDMLSILRRNVVKDGKLDASFVTNTLFRGHVANLGREGVFTMVYLGLYDRITHAVNERNGNKSMGTVVCISSFTGALAWIANYPFDTVKSVMQARSAHHERISMRQAMRTIYNSGGWRAFWRGAGPSTIRAMLVTSSRMFAYEKTLQLLRDTPLVDIA